MPGGLVNYEPAVDNEEDAQRRGAVAERLSGLEGQGEDGDVDGRSLARRSRQSKYSRPSLAGVRNPLRQPGLPGEGLVAVDGPVEGGKIVGSHGWSSREGRSRPNPKYRPAPMRIGPSTSCSNS